MLTAPASKVSEPVLVILTCVSSAESDLLPPPITPVVVSNLPVWEEIHVKLALLESVKTIWPELMVVAAEAFQMKPDVLLGLLLVSQEVETYPLVSIPPASPNCTRISSVPLRDTPSKVIVILFVPAGIPVKSKAVPDVVACSVPSVIPPLDTTAIPSAFVILRTRTVSAAVEKHSHSSPAAVVIFAAPGILIDAPCVTVSAPSKCNINRRFAATVIMLNSVVPVTSK